MASPTPFSIDDQEERHFIGDLLSEEDVFEQSDGTHIGELLISGSSSF